MNLSEYKLEVLQPINVGVAKKLAFRFGFDLE